jgi:hypothetical protein
MRVFNQNVASAIAVVVVGKIQVSWCSRVNYQVYFFFINLINEYLEYFTLSQNSKKFGKIWKFEICVKVVQCSAIPGIRSKDGLSLSSATFGLKYCPAEWYTVQQ